MMREIGKKNLNNRIVDNVCGDIDDVKDGQGQEQLVERGKHLGLPEQVKTVSFFSFFLFAYFFFNFYLPIQFF